MPPNETLTSWTAKPATFGSSLDSTRASYNSVPGKRNRRHGDGGVLNDIVWSVATLYRCNTPTDWLCPCGRIARTLRRDAIPFEEVVVPQRRARRPEVEALTDQRRVPVLVIDGEAICDSRRIVEHLEARRASA
jgi:glutaredoxin